MLLSSLSPRCSSKSAQGEKCVILLLFEYPPPSTTYYGRANSRSRPPGFPIGPSLWNLVFSELLFVVEEERFPATAYVKDLAVVAASNIRPRLKEEAENQPSRRMVREEDEDAKI